MACNIKLRQKINKKEIFFAKCLIDPHPPMPCCHCKLHPSCKTYQTQTVKKIRGEDIIERLEDKTYLKQHGAAAQAFNPAAQDSKQHPGSSSLMVEI